MMKTQANLERNLEICWQQVNNQSCRAEQVFSKIEDWILELNGHKAFLHPIMKQWLWYDPVHDEWVFAGCGTREGILLKLDGTFGVKKLPCIDDVANWCIYLQAGQPYGPLHINELRGLYQSGQINSENLIWTTHANEWLRASEWYQS